ncbi:hypothetical protein NE236_15040 [Actinoallomurus purpureus]|uniref:hypothetical protein n=1 Tax=Actinoallomurus purpureus TaxID=478114 RepID=UPI002091F689|nr:hypothetical protein [Actinoallomurus purpureus]MCO6006305.1 hypothetical protein [Actinoallomurus purpureus]
MPPLNDGGTQSGSQYPKVWIGGGAPDVKWAPSKIGHAASILEDALEALGGTGALGNVQAQGLVTAAELGNWDAGQALAGTTQAAHEHITAVFQDLIRQYAAAIQTLRKTAANYADTEAGLTKHERRIGGQAQPASAENPTWHNVPSAD